MTEEPLDSATTWAHFVDPSEPGQRFRCDLTWLTSSYHCIFGAGCPGIYADRPDDGCCTLGAHFTDEDDVRRVQAVVDVLTPHEWQQYDVGHTTGWTEIEEGESMTAVVDGACILLNRPGFPGGSGCALHAHALATGIAPYTAKPDVCWQLPLRRSYAEITLPDDGTYLEVTIAEYDRRGWGPGGHDLDWYCSRAPEAHTAAMPLYLGAAGELRELMGGAAYDVLAARCEAHLASVAAVRALPDGARLLPLLVHPATLRRQAAESEGT